MLYGNPQTVAVELVEGPPGFCGMSLGLGGACLGDANLYVPAGAIAEAMAWFCGRAHLRVRPDALESAGQDFLNKAYEAEYGTGHKDTEALVPEEYAPFLLSPNLCECLDSHVIVVVSHGAEQRILSRSLLDGSTRDVRVSSGALEAVFEAARETLLRLDALRERSSPS